MKLEATKEHVQAKYRMRRKAISSGQAKLGKCVHFEVSKNGGWKFSLKTLRMREIEDVIRFRHGSMIPDPGDTDDRETCMAYIEAAAFTATKQNMHSWCAKWAPWATKEEIDAIVSRSSGRRRMLKADAAAKLLHVTMKDRTALDLNTIGACDISTAERKAIAKANKRERDKNRQERKRREIGMVDRKSQQAQTLAVTKPWEAEGISRRTWFYRQKRNCTAMSPVDIKTISDTSVQSGSQLGLPPTPPQIQAGQRRVAGLVGGLGHHAPAGFQGAVPHGRIDTNDERAA